MDDIEEYQAGGVFAPVNPKLSTQLSAASIGKVNDFIKKLNFEKYNIHYAPQKPSIL